MTRTESFISHNFFIVFLETNFLHVSCYPALFIVSRKYISVFRSLHLPLDTQFWTRGFPLVMRSRNADLPLATRARKRELCLFRYVSRMTRKFYKSTFFIVFLETTFLHVSCYPALFWFIVRYLSRLIRTKNFQSTFFHGFSFTGNQFSPRYASLFIVSRKYLFDFWKSAPTPR